MKRIPDHEITRRIRSLCELLKANDEYNEVVEYVSKEGLSDVFMGEGKLYCPWYI